MEENGRKAEITEYCNSAKILRGRFVSKGMLVTKQLIWSKRGSKLSPAPKMFKVFRSDLNSKS